MATRTVKARVELDGEKQYKEALNELNNGNKVLASEMKKLQAEYKGNAESTEFLTKKGELLERQMLQQKEKVATLRKAVDEAAATYGESSSKTQAWIVKLNNAEAAEYNLQHAIDENDKALKGENETMQGLGDTVNDLASKLGIRLPEGATKALNGMQGLSAGTVAAMATAAAAVAALFKAVSELHEKTLEAAKEADDIATKSLTTGVSAETLQKWEYASELVDVSVDTMSGALTKLTRNMAAASDGNEAMAAKFADLGVSIQDGSGHLRDSEDVFLELVDALGQISNETERDAAAMEILGKSAKDLNPLIVAGSDALRQYGEEAENVGYVLDESQIKKLLEVDDAYQKMQKTIDGVKKELAVQFAPASKEAMELFTKVVKAAGEALERSQLIANIASIFKSLLSVTEAAGKLFGAIPEWMNPLSILSSALQGLATLMATIADTANLIAGIMPWNWGSGMARTALGFNPNKQSNLQSLMYGSTSYAGNSYNAATGLYSGNYFSGNATGNDNWRGGLTWVGESGPELAMLPAGTRIMSAQESRSMGGDTFVFNIDPANIREFNDLVRVAESARVVSRMR